MLIEFGRVYGVPTQVKVVLLHAEKLGGVQARKHSSVGKVVWVCRVFHDVCVCVGVLVCWCGGDRTTVVQPPPLGLADQLDKGRDGHLLVPA